MPSPDPPLRPRAGARPESSGRLCGDDYLPWTSTTSATDSISRRPLRPLPDIDRLFAPESFDVVIAQPRARAPALQLHHRAAEAARPAQARRPPRLLLPGRPERQLPQRPVPEPRSTGSGGCGSARRTTSAASPARTSTAPSAWSSASTTPTRSRASSLRRDCSPPHIPPPRWTLEMGPVFIVDLIPRSLADGHVPDRGSTGSAGPTCSTTSTSASSSAASARTRRA